MARSIENKLELRVTVRPGPGGPPAGPGPGPGGGSDLKSRERTLPAAGRAAAVILKAAAVNGPGRSRRVGRSRAALAAGAGPGGHCDLRPLSDQVQVLAVTAASAGLTRSQVIPDWAGSCQWPHLEPWYPLISYMISI
jgi:hypothetical protein